jgi:hypothetical protein
VESTQKQRLGGCLVNNNDKVAMVFYEWFQMQEPHLYHDKICELMPKWKNA